MTCIVGLVHKGRSFIGCDTLGSDWSSKDVYSTKIFKNGPFWIGFTTSFRMGDILRYSTKFPPIGKKDLDEYMRTDFIQTLQKTFKNNNWISTNEGKSCGGNFIVVVRNRVFEIQDEFSVLETKQGFASVGCGDPYAKASLATSKDWDSGEKRVLRALEVASEFSCGVGGDLIVQECTEKRRRKK